MQAESNSNQVDVEKKIETLEKIVIPSLKKYLKKAEKELAKLQS